MAVSKEKRKGLFYYFVTGVFQSVDKFKVPAQIVVDIIRKEMDKIEAMEDE